MRPTITCHMITSLDGRLHPHRWSDPAGGTMAGLVSRTYEATAAELGADGWIVGRRTMAELAAERPEAPRLDAPRPDTLHDRPSHIVPRNGRQLAIAVDPSGRLVFDSGEMAGEQVVVILSTRVPDAILTAHRDAGVAYVFAGPAGRDLDAALAAIGEGFGVHHLLLEGGGRTNGAFLAAGLIDHVSTLIVPAIDGLAGVASIYDAPGEPDARPAKDQHLRLASCGTLAGGIIWLRHDVVRAKAGGSDGAGSRNERPDRVRRRDRATAGA